MNNNEVKTDNIIFECMIALKNEKYNVLLSLTEKDLFFKKKKGIFQKKYKIINDISINNIKVINEKVKIEQKKNKITIYTQDDEVCFFCENVIDSKRIVEEINKLILGENFLKRTSKKGVKALNIVKDTAKVVGGLAIASAGAYEAIKENKDSIKQAAKSIVSIFKK